MTAEDERTDGEAGADAGPDAGSGGGDAPRRRAVLDALELARLQVEVLTELREAESRGDEEAVARAHLSMDRVMADVARVEEVRGGRAEAGGAVADELACGGCGAMARPRYPRPRLLGYDCPQCGWKSHDPAAQAEEKLAEARHDACVKLGKAVTALAGALPELSGRKQARRHGTAAVDSVRDQLDTARRRVENAKAGTESVGRTS